MGAPATGLLPREATAVSVYVREGNKTDALRQAGYPHPNDECDRVFNRPRVQSALAKIRAKLSEDYIVNDCVKRIKENLALESKSRDIHKKVKVGYLHNDTIRTVGRICNDEPANNTPPFVLVIDNSQSEPEPKKFDIYV